MDRRYQAACRRIDRKKLIRLRKEAGLNTYLPLLNLRRVMGDRDFAKIEHLLDTNVRNGFKKSLKDQLLDWLHNDRPAYPVPLTARQLNALVIEPYRVYPIRK